MTVASLLFATQLVAPYVPTVAEDVALMLDIADVGPGDYLIDLGAGDGRIVIAAARRGAIAHGVELTESLVDLSRSQAAAAGVADRTAFLHGDIFDADIGAATVVTVFLMPDANLRLRPKLLSELAPGTRLVSNSFDMGDWEADRIETGRTSGGVLLWIIPAQVAGTWRLSIDDAALDGADLSLQLEQHYQQITAALTGPGGDHAVSTATLRGDRIAFVGAGEAHQLSFHGTVTDGRMAGFVQIRDGGAARLARWQAHRDVP